MSKRLTLLDPLNLRTTSVYRNPRDISVLKIIFGDLTSSKILCTPIDKDGYVHHASDSPMQLITKVFVEGEPKTGGYKAYTAYQDETGYSIACVIFDEPQYEKQVSISGKGFIDLTNGALIENPADFIRELLLDIQGYDDGSIDTGEIARFYADCLKADIQVVCVLDQIVTLKALHDELGQNLHAHWLLSDGKSVMRLRDILSGETSKYNFKEEEIADFEISSEPLLNEITINYGYDFLNQHYQSSLTKHNPLSKRIYDDAKDTYDLKMIQTARQAERVADAVLKTYSIPQIICSFKHNARSIHIEPGDIVTITHRAGLGDIGYNEDRGLVIKKSHIESIHIVSPWSSPARSMLPSCSLLRR
jgi:hypothetical protein